MPSLAHAPGIESILAFAVFFVLCFMLLVSSLPALILLPFQPPRPEGLPPTPNKAMRRTRIWAAVGLNALGVAFCFSFLFSLQLTPQERPLLFTTVPLVFLAAEGLAFLLRMAYLRAKLRRWRTPL